MKTIKNIFSGLAIISGFVLSVAVVHAQLASVLRQAVSTNLNLQAVSADDLTVMLKALEQTTPTAAESVPWFGTFYSTQNQNWPPLPGDINNLPAWDLGNGTWLLADQDFDYTALAQQNAAMHMLARSMGLEMGSEEMGSTFTIDTNGLWLEITNVLNGLAYLNLHNATNMVYEVWSKTDLTFPDWNIEQEVWPVTGLEPTPFTVPELARTNLFIWARDWTGITSGGNETPEWWFWKFFHTVGLSDTNLDSQGNTLLSDYQNGTDPNIITFQIVVTNNYVNTSDAPVQLNIFGGVPSYVAVLVNDLNQADAVWQPYTSSNIVTTLGPTNATYGIFVGLRGLPSDAAQAWRQTSVTLYSDMPTLTITNPTTSTVSQSPIQLQGYASTPLASLTFDVSNAVGIFTNQTGFLTGQFYDTNSQIFTTNYFQCYDIVLTSGLNTITLHATDLTGSIAITNFRVALDYSSDTTPPALAILWPQDGTTVSGSNFTLQAQMDDATATVTAQIADSNGNTNTVRGLVERTGLVWAQNLPLAAGTNILAVTATDAAGNTSVTNIAVVQSPVTVTTDPISNDQLNRSTVTVTGTIDNSDDTVMINSITATVNDDGTWEADNVPVSPTGTAVLNTQVRDADDNPLAEQNVSQLQPPMVVLSDFWQKSVINIAQRSTVKWDYAGGGNWSWVNDLLNPGVGNLIPPDGDGYTPPVAIPYAPNIFAPPWQNANASYYNGNTFETSVKTTVMIVPSGPKPPGSVKLYLVSASAMMFVPLVHDNGDASFGSPSFLWPNNQGNVPIPSEQLLINGQPLVGNLTNDDGSIWGETIISAPAGALMPLTMTTANPDYNDYTFKVRVSELIPPIVDANRDGNISADNQDQTSPNEPYRFWINDSQENGDVTSGSDTVPGSSSPNYALNHVNGRCDLINFFPVALCLSNVMQWLPPTNGWEYHLSQADSAVKFVYTSLTPDNAFDYLTNATATAGYGVNAEEAPQSMDTIAVSSSGTTLDMNWLAQVQANGGNGVVLMEGGAATTQPLNLEIWKNGQKLGSVSLYLSISGVEQMFRQINLRDGYTGPPPKPPNYPDRLSNGKQFVFVHGYNVNATQARGWNAEMFKRLYQSRSRAMFTGVDWQGDDGQIPVVGITPDYYVNVIHAFDTALYFSMAMRDLPGGKYIAAHSLGNMVVSSAIADWSQSSTVGFQYNGYFMIDAAVAMEAYDTSFGNNQNLVPPQYWPNYHTNLWANEWFSLFANDSRTNLAWQNRFGNIPNAYNYYSSTENVLADADGQMHSIYANQYAWVNQEMNKGTWPLPLSLIVNNEAGWGFNIYYSTYSVAQANQIPNSQLQTNSFFERFDDSMLYDPNDGSAEAAKASVREKVLSDGIPALSNPAGGNFLGINFGVQNADRNMNGYKGLNANGLWPRSGDDWQHSDIINIAFPFNHAVFNQIVTDGGLR